MPDYAKELNPEQLAVVQNGDGPCLVLAGAGSGKTRTITYRVAHLLEQGVAADEILLVTFTNKAAREMIQRVERLVKVSDNTRSVLPWAGTFHHIAFRILRRYAVLLGYREQFTILDSEDSLALVKASLAAHGVERKDKMFPSPAVMQSLISFARNAERSLHDVVEERNPRWIETLPTLEAVREEYTKRKREANAMDFDDLLLNLALLLAKSERVREKYAQQFRFILVDEYQDTNKIQATIIRLLASVHRNVLVVGDDAQSIYSFRAADIANILDFEKTYGSAQIFRLETNYRSTPEILALANDVIANNRQQYPKKLKSVAKSFVKPEVRGYADQQEEARAIADKVVEMHDEGVSLIDMAVLFRASFHSQALEIELVKRGIPYEYRGGVKFFERAHIKDVLAFLRVLLNKDDVIAWSRILSMQAGIGPASAEKLIVAIRQISDIKTITHVGDMLSARAQVGWKDFVSIWSDLLAKCGDEVSGVKPAELIEVLLQSSYVQYLEANYPDYKDRIADIEQLQVYAERQSDPQQFLAEATMQESFARPRTTEVQEEDSDKLILSTIHQAKGLEWNTVFVMHLASGQFPNERATRENNGIEEERRLFYVAITRAKSSLFLSYPLLAQHTMVLSGPSMFLEDLDRSLVEEFHFHETLGNVYSGGDDDIVYEAIDEPFPSTPRPRRSGFLKDISEL